MSTSSVPNPFAGMSIGQAEAAMGRKQLEMLAEQGRDPRIQELARDALAGRTDLRAAMLGGRYKDALNDAMATFSSWYHDLSEEQRAEQLRQGDDYLEQARREAAAEGHEIPRRFRRPPGDDEDWEPPASLIRNDPPSQ